MRVRPGDVIMVFPDGTVVGQPRLTFETDEWGSFICRVTLDVERLSKAAEQASEGQEEK